MAISLLAREAKAALDRDSLELVWYDNFSGASLDWDKWVVDEGDGCDINLCDWGNGEQQVSRIFIYVYPTTKTIMFQIAKLLVIFVFCI